jgi:hypothetical protein
LITNLGKKDFWEKIATKNQPPRNEKAGLNVCPYFVLIITTTFYLRPELLVEELLELLLLGAVALLLETELPLLTEGEDWREELLEELTFGADLVLGAD